MSINEATPAELQFQMYRLGSRRRIARLYRVRSDVVYKLFPITAVDRLMSGQMVSIGGILVKRCSLCGTARELDYYWADDDRASGCGAWCRPCRLKR